MILRKNRTHHTGSSNLLDRQALVRPMTQPGETRLAAMTRAKENQVNEVIEKKASRVVSTPFENTRAFYGQQGKLERQKTAIGQPRLLQLEEPEKMKMPFTGESDLIYDRNLGKYRDDPGSPAIGWKEFIDKEHLAKEKHEIHAKAIQETQLVGYDNYNLDTIKNNVNLEKVREAKRILRRKYASRKNMHMIFSAWDYDRTGSITIQNLYAMTKRLGLNLNYDEARVLLASADKNGTATLSLDEFVDLIHNKDDALNLDLDKLSKYHENYLLPKEELDDDNIIKNLEEDAKKRREIKHFNQVNLILKNKLNEIVSNFLQLDTFKKGYTTYDCFEQSIRKLGVDEKLVSHDDIKALFHKYKTDEHTINYRTFIDGLKNFNFLLEDAYKEYTVERPQTASSTSNKKIVTEPSKMYEPQINIVDFKNLPYSTVYNYLGKKRRVSRLIQKFFPSKDDLKNYFSQVLGISKEETDNHFITKKQTKDAIINLFKKFDVNNLTHRDFEGFLSSFVYNKHDFTQMGDVLNGIYDEDEEDLIKKINNRKKGPPPHKDLAFTSMNGIEGSQENMTSQDGFQLDSGEKQKKIFEILQRFENRVFMGKSKAYDIYKMFDVDGDGYVSRKDFVKKIEEIHLVPKEDIPILVDYLDSQNKGYVNFREFHKKIRVNASQQDEDAQPTVFPSVMPSKENFAKTANLMPGVRKKLDDITEEFKPENALLRPSSRFGSTPAWRNTFTIMQAPMSSPMFITERMRFISTPDANVLPSMEEKEKKKRIQSAKIDVLKQNQANLQKRVEQDMAREDNLDQNRLKTKVMSLATHEQNARLRNNYML